MSSIQPIDTMARFYMICLCHPTQLQTQLSMVKLAQCDVDVCELSMVLLLFLDLLQNQCLIHAAGADKKSQPTNLQNSLDQMLQPLLNHAKSN
uniref:Uncharacterized protein n=2 Tax=Oryza glumipatula TaxID=40148 RepID=A0A0E0A4Y6_9ORYZ